MKKSFFSLAILALIFAGCSNKAPEITSTEVSPQEDLSIKPIYFDFDKSFIRDDQWGQTVENSKAVNQGEKQGQVVILEGNCDHWGSDEYNFALGLKRAKSVKEQMIASGVNENRIEIISNGESKPVCSEKTKDCDQLNRRVETILQ